jgi:hypothetical protein
MADVRQQVTISLMTEFENFSVVKTWDVSTARGWSTARDRVRVVTCSLVKQVDTARLHKDRVSVTSRILP